MKVLITGCRGQLGRALVGSVPENYQAIACDRSTLDIANRDQVFSCVGKVRPDVIVNAAAYTAVDRAESDAETAFGINAVGVGHLVQAANEVGAKIAHISTDFVFCGSAGKPYSPDAETAPLGVYGKSKLEGERSLRSSDLLLRTAWVYDADGANFLNTMLRLFVERDNINVVCDQIGTPTFAGDLADCIWRLVELNTHGAFHYTNAGVASWYDFAVAIREEAEKLGLLEKSAAISPILSRDYPTPARRPSYSVLNSFKTYRCIGRPARHWRAALRDALKEKK